MNHHHDVIINTIGCQTTNTTRATVYFKKPIIPSLYKRLMLFVLLVTHQLYYYYIIGSLYLKKIKKYIYK